MSVAEYMETITSIPRPTIERSDGLAIFDVVLYADIMRRLFPEVPAATAAGDVAAMARARGPFDEYVARLKRD